MNFELFLGIRNLEFFATCARGLEPILVRELEAIGAVRVQSGRGGVHFTGDATTIYKASLWLRTAVRILRPILDVHVRNPDELYDAVRSINWANYLTIDRTLAVDCNVRDSGITHSQYAARRVKDAICDQFRDRCGLRPSVDVEFPAIGLNLHIFRDHAKLSLDASWNSLHKRGYRPVLNRAPLNEALTAGLLQYLGYDGTEPLVDPMCGSGTFAIEGAWIATRRPPGLTRKWFGFFGWPDFDAGMWSAVRDEARKQMLPTLPNPVMGSDIRSDAIMFSVGNAKAAGVGNLVRFDKLDMRMARPPAGPPGLIVCNPPYGERVGDEAELEELYTSIGTVVEKHWPGWRLAVFTEIDELAKRIRLDVRRKTPFFNGSLPCKLWEFEPV